MTARYAISGIFGALISLLTSQLALASDCDTPVTPGKKPVMETYADYSDFLVAIMEFKARSRAKAAQEVECPKILVVQSNPDSLDPTVTYGPETLESATARTEKLKPSIYPADGKWYQRSTSRSFTLPALATAQMDHQSIATQIRTLVDAPIPAREQQLALNNLGPLPDDDGRWGPNVAERQLHDELTDKERGPSFALAGSDLFADEIQNYTYADNSGYLRTYYKNGELIRVETLVSYCLSGL